MKTRHYTTEFHFTARIKAWILRRFGYRTRIEEIPDQTMDLLGIPEYYLYAWKDEQMDMTPLHCYYCGETITDNHSSCEHSNSAYQEERKSK